MNWASYNPNVETDAAIWARKIAGRPKAVVAAAAAACIALACLFAFMPAGSAQPPAEFATLAEGGPIGPDGRTQVACDIPAPLRQENVGGRDGAGLCVFTSIEHSARYQNERRLWNFQKQMTQEPGGGYPDKVDAMIAKYAPGTRYIQHVNGDLEFLYAAIRTGRPPDVTYAGMDMHYGKNRKVAHMVTLVHLDPPSKSPRLACVLDNNYIGANQLVWMTADEFKTRWLAMGGGWAVVLLAPPPPPPVRLKNSSDVEGLSLPGRRVVSQALLEIAGRPGFSEEQRQAIRELAFDRGVILRIGLRLRDEHPDKAALLEADASAPNRPLLYWLTHGGAQWLYDIAQIVASLLGYHLPPLPPLPAPPPLPN